MLLKTSGTQVCRAIVLLLLAGSGRVNIMNEKLSDFLGPFPSVLHAYGPAPFCALLAREWFIAVKKMTPKNEERRHERKRISHGHGWYSKPQILGPRSSRL